jgi:hypothetical protein|tara:strand:- start:5021 stop:5452 length:432 start_codon:yes stop_codon:yes gene_type:complete
MKFLTGIIILILSTGCVNNPETISLQLHENFNKGDENYLVVVSTYPQKLLAGHPFTVNIEIKNIQNLDEIQHINYDCQIQDNSGTIFFVDSLHSMKGRSYQKNITLEEKGFYIFKLTINQGMGTSTEDIYNNDLKFTVGESIN